jgi:hypothetical protein
MWALDLDEADEACHRAIDTAERLGSKALWADATEILGGIRMYQGDPVEAVRLLESAWDAAIASGNGIAEINVTYFLNLLAVNYWRPGEAVTWVERGLERPHISQSPGRRDLLHLMATWGHVLGGPRAVADARHEVGHRRDTWCCRYISLLDGDYDQAMMLQNTQDLRATVISVGGDLWNVWMLTLAGRHDEAEAAARAVRAVEGGRQRAVTTAAGGWLAGSLVALGRLDEAASLLADGPEPGVAAWQGWGAQVAIFELARARLSLARGDAVTAERHALAAQDAAERNGHGPLAFEGWLAAGRARQAAGDVAGALVALDGAAAVAEHLGLRGAWTERLARQRASTG